MSATLELMTVTACGSMNHSAQLNTQVVVRKAVHMERRKLSAFHFFWCKDSTISNTLHANGL